MVDGRIGWSVDEWLGPIQKNSPCGGPSDSMMERAAARSCWEPQRVPYGDTLDKPFLSFQ